jgi:hypothetical protein
MLHIVFVYHKHLKQCVLWRGANSCRLCASSNSFHKCFYLVLRALLQINIAERHASWSRICPVRIQLKSSRVKNKLRDQVVTNVNAVEALCNDPWYAPSTYKRRCEGQRSFLCSLRIGQISLAVLFANPLYEKWVFQCCHKTCCLGIQLSIIETKR